LLSDSYILIELHDLNCPAITYLFTFSYRLHCLYLYSLPWNE